MQSLDRRAMLLGIAAAGAAVGGSIPAARAAAPKTGKQAPGFYRYKVGDLEVTVVTDGARSFALTPDYVVNAPIADVRQALLEARLPADQMTHHYAPIVINTGSRLIVIDTGSGPAALAETNGAVGQFITNLTASGIDPNSVDAVVISHFHPDHVNGLVDANGRPVFPQAEVLVPSVEWKYWMDDGEMSRAPKGRMEALFKNNRRVFDAIGRKVTQYDWNKEIVSGLLPIPTLGHSIGHTSFVMSSGKDKIFVQSDVTNNPDLFARRADWGGNFDQDPAMAVATRRRVYDMLVAEKMLVQGFHYPFPGLGWVEKAEGGYKVTAAPWNPIL